MRFAIGVDDLQRSGSHEGFEHVGQWEHRDLLSRNVIGGGGMVPHLADVASGWPLNPGFHEAVEHHLAPGLVELDRQLVAVDRFDRARSEFRVEDPPAFD